MGRELDKSCRVISKIIYETFKEMRPNGKKNIFEGEFEKYYANYVRNISPFKPTAFLITKKCLNYLEREFINNCTRLFLTQQKDNDYVDVFNYAPLFCSAKLDILEEFNYLDENELLNSNNEEAITKYNNLVLENQKFNAMSVKINESLKNNDLENHKEPINKKLINGDTLALTFIVGATGAIIGTLVWALYSAYKSSTYFDPNHFSTGDIHFDNNLADLSEGYNLIIDDLLLKINDKVTKLSPEEYKSAYEGLLYKSQNDFLQDYNLNMDNYKDVVYTNELVEITKTQAIELCKKEHNLAREELAKYYNFDSYQELENYLNSQQASWAFFEEFKVPEAKIMYEHLQNLDDLYDSQLHAITGYAGLIPVVPLPPPLGWTSSKYEFPITTNAIDPQYEDMLMKFNCHNNIIYSAYIDNLDNSFGTYFTDDLQTQIMTSEINEISENRQYDIINKFREFIKNREELDTTPTEDLSSIVDASLSVPTITGACVSALVRSSKPLYTMYANKKVEKKINWAKALNKELERMEQDKECRLDKDNDELTR